MITGELRNKIDKIWETFWTGGITNPLDVIEQFTYLLFIKQLDDVETTKENEANFLGVPYESMFPDECQKYRWSKFKNLGSADEMYDLVLNKVFPFIKNLHQDGDSAYARYMGDAIFKIPTAGMLTKIVDGIDKLELGDDDSKGDLYEYLLSKVATAGTNGQFRTPRHIIKMMVDLVKPQPEDTIIDPAMGSAGFLIEAQAYLREKHADILFLADRTALVKQAKNNYTNLLPDLSCCNLLDSKDDPESCRMIFSTYPTMMNAIDEKKNKFGERLFTPAHFDLIICDEVHRSIYRKYQEIFEYFDGMLLGLTATPKNEIDKNTYGVFDLERGVPTFAYELEKAVEEGYLVNYSTLEYKTKIMEDGKYSN